MNPRVSHVLVGIVAFALGAGALHLVTLQAMAAAERRELAEAQAIAAAPVDVGRATAFLRGLDGREHVRSAAVVREARGIVLRAVERDLVAAIDVRSGVYVPARGLPLLRLLEEEFAADATAHMIRALVEQDLAAAARACESKARDGTPLAKAQAMVDCPFATDEVKAYYREFLAKPR
jgi:hypothetical protein